MTNAGALRLESDAATGDHQPRRDHELWLAMQAAHDQWMESTETLDDLVAMGSSDIASPDVSLRIAKAAEEERSGFEAYIEARLAFSEFLLTRDTTSAIPKPGTVSKRTLLAVALVFPAIFGLPYAMHERTQVRDLDAARAAIVALSSQPRSQPAEVRVDATPHASTPVVQAVVRTPPETGHWRRVGTPPPQPQKRAVRQTAPRKNTEFRLTPSARSAHLGPIRISLQNLDPKREWFDLSVMLGDFRLERKHVRRFEAVWINLGGNNAPIRLIADRIGRNEVHGYLGTPAPKPPTSTSQRIKNAGSPTRGKSLAQSPSSTQPNGG